MFFYFWNKFFTFEVKKKDKLETIRFVLVYLVAFGLEYALKFLLKNVAVFNEMIVSIITVFVTMIVSFVGQKFFVFKHKKKAKQDLQENENQVQESAEILNK